jgi:hypothetical protein
LHSVTVSIHDITEPASEVSVEPIQGDPGGAELSHNPVVQSSIDIRGRVRVGIQSHCVRVPVFENAPLDNGRNSGQILSSIQSNVFTLAVNPGDLIQQGSFCSSQRTTGKWRR